MHIHKTSYNDFLSFLEIW